MSPEDEAVAEAIYRQLLTHVGLDDSGDPFESVKLCDRAEEIASRVTSHLGHFADGVQIAIDSLHD